MREWEYRKLALSPLPRKVDEVDLLSDAGKDGWELVVILPNSIAYLKRAIVEEEAEPSVPEHDDTVVRVGEARVKYRDAATGETWSGRGRMVTWLKRKQDAGEDIEKYRVAN